MSRHALKQYFRGACNNSWKIRFFIDYSLKMQYIKIRIVEYTNYEQIA
jgi:hypothetical protein